MNILVLVFCLLATCQSYSQKSSPYIQVLGIAQDGGIPQVGCTRNQCKRRFSKGIKYQVSSLGIVNKSTNQSWIIDATPDLPYQYTKLSNQTQTILSGIFLTHAHIGHYSGLMFLGREVMYTSHLPVYVMPKMKRFLETNGPWDQLIKLNNIELKTLSSKIKENLAKDLYIMPILVPHRDEYSETVGYLIVGPNKKVLYIPDIDKWSKWNESITNWLKKVDRAYIDGTFYTADEIKLRISEVPHPLVKESIDKFKSLALNDRKKIHFIHFNHTNPLLFPNSTQRQSLLSQGFNIAHQGDIFYLR